MSFTECSCSNTNRYFKGHAWIAYNTSKSAVLQMTRSMACELGSEGIRVNSLSPGHIYTKYVLWSWVLAPAPFWIHNHRMTAQYLEPQPHLEEKWSSLNPLGRLGRVDEMRGVAVWLASDASTYCTGSEWVSRSCPDLIEVKAFCSIQYPCWWGPSCVVRLAIIPFFSFGVKWWCRVHVGNQV